jgi:hypothetical protein
MSAWIVITSPSAPSPAAPQRQELPSGRLYDLADFAKLNLSPVASRVGAHPDTVLSQPNEEAADDHTRPRINLAHQLRFCGARAPQHKPPMPYVADLAGEGLHGR